MDDYDALVALFDELDEFHHLARPDVFRRFDGPARTRGQIEAMARRRRLDGAGRRAEWDGRRPGRAADASAVALLPAQCRSRRLSSITRWCTPSLRSQGIGRRLIEATIAWSRGQGASRRRRSRACLQPKCAQVLRSAPDLHRRSID